MDESLFRKVPVKVQKKSGFDLSFQNLLTTKVGTITPVLCEELIPNETIHLDAAIQAQLPPLASDTFMRCDLKYEAFFVPNRLIMAGYEEWLVPGSTMGTGSSSAVTPVIPQIALKASEIKPGSLADYLGVKSNIPVQQSGSTGYNPSWTSASTIAVNALPFLAYHRIYDDWYRNTMVQTPIYRSPGVLGAGSNASSYGVTFSAANSLYSIPNVNHGYILSVDTPSTTTNGNTKAYMDGVLVTSLRQRNFGIDRFTSATPSAQNGQAQGLSMQVTDSAAGFTIGQLRAANAIQQWLERNNLAGNKLVDYVKANYNADLSYGVAQRSILLGSGQFAVYSKGIYQTQTQQETESVTPNNPFGSVGAQYGSAFASGNETIIGSFTAQEPGYLFVMCTLVPKVTYSTGIDRKLIRYIDNSRTDMANPMLQGTGNEPIWQSELNVDKVFLGNGAIKNDSYIFGYQERYADWKSKADELHGLLREKSSYLTEQSQVTADQLVGSLSSFALQSTFDGNDSLTISSDFLKIPTDYLDNVSAVATDISNYGCWIDTYFNFKASMPLARYSLPTLQDPAYEHGDDVVLDRGGKRL